MGFKTKLRLVTRDTMLTKFCSVPNSEVHVSPRVGWAQDFADPQTVLDPTFNGDNIIPSNNSNWPELDVPEINKTINDAKLVTDPAERAQGVGRREQGDRGGGACDSLHVGIPARCRLAQRARRAER